MIYQGKRLLQLDRIAEASVISNLIEFILAISDTFSLMDRIEVQEICQILSTVLKYIDHISFEQTEDDWLT
jgi:small-conductance mechanosensitive channel